MTVTEQGPPAGLVDRVELRVPADPAYLAVLRTASAGLAARMDLTLDEIEDLRIAVDEACALLLPSSRDVGTGELRAVFDVGDDVLEIEVSGPAARLPERSSFAWAVLEALVGEIDAVERVGEDGKRPGSGSGSGGSSSEDARSAIRLRHRRASQRR